MKNRSRRQRIVILGAAVVVLAALGAVAARIAAPWYVRTHMIPDAGARHGLTASCEDVSLSVLAGAVTITNLRLAEPANDTDALFTAKRIEGNISLSAYLGGRVVVQKAVMDRPVIRARLEGRGDTNLGRVLQDILDSVETDGPAILIEELHVHGGTFEFDDAITDPAHPFRGVVRDAESVVLDAQILGRPDAGRFGQFRVDGRAGPSGQDSPLTIVAWTMPDGGVQHLVAHLAITGFRPDDAPQYVDATQRAFLGADELDVVVSADVTAGMITRGAAVARVPGRDHPLTAKFSGPAADPVIDTSGSLAALFELPFARSGTVGDVVWGVGSGIVGGAVGIVEHLAQLDVIGAGGAVVEGVGRGLGAIGGGIGDALGGLGDALGISSGAAPAGKGAPGSKSNRDLVSIHTVIRAALLDVRVKAAAAWLAEHPGARVREDL